MLHRSDSNTLLSENCPATMKPIKQPPQNHMRHKKPVPTIRSLPYMTAGHITFEMSGVA